jgi:hypothetical protein
MVLSDFCFAPPRSNFAGAGIEVAESSFGFAGVEELAVDPSPADEDGTSAALPKVWVVDCPVQTAAKRRSTSDRFLVIIGKSL